ncbi:MAG TPA: hypothetical protein VN611_05650 [Patescibacteria group bacterium]|nr:hypothetical protein [Patescibacteria group bacterium]
MEFILFPAAELESRTDKNGLAAEILGEKAEKFVVKSAQGLSRFIPRKVRVEVWSENIPYISHTADLLAEELGVKRKFTKSIGQEDFDTLQQMIQEHAPDKCVVVVGECPRILQWCQQLLGYELPFNECSAAGFRMEDGKGALLWFVRQTELGRIR